ncbi:unnamed protein product [Schistosoma curassoni]|uniref:Uncharacterized protein n=1 Tax=Schistosoma curassoni TaxID=6186 RepID=A0A183JGU8_9TREM|nr:unnamed protein product [Schistosoma curassoni]
MRTISKYNLLSIFVASDVTKRTISRNNMIIYNITDKIAIKSARNPILKAANFQATGPIDVAKLSHVSQYSGSPMKSGNSPLMPVVVSGSQCIFNGDTYPIFSSVTLEAHNQIPSFNVNCMNTVKIKKSIPCKKEVYTEPSGSRPNTKSITMLIPNKNILPDTMLYPTNRRGGYKGTLHLNVTQDGHYSHCASRPSIRQTAVNQRAPWLLSDALIIEPVRCNFSHHFLNGQDGLLGYAPSTQPQLAGACLSCPSSQIQQINPPYQNNGVFDLQKFLVPLVLESVQAIGHTISQTY